MKARLLSLLCSLLLLTGCQTTEVLNIWSDDSQSEKFSDVLVIAIFKEPAYRNITEQRLVVVLQAQGVEAESASILYPQEGPMDQDIIDGMVAQSSADSVMMVRLVDAAGRGRLASVQEDRGGSGRAGSSAGGNRRWWRLLR